jgi:hypothetical protein
MDKQKSRGRISVENATKFAREPQQTETISPSLISEGARVEIVRERSGKCEAEMQQQQLALSPVVLSY